MSAPTYPVFFTGSSGTAHTSEVAQGGFILDFPFGERRPDAFTVRQKFQQLRTSYVRPAPNALNCSAYPTARFCSDDGFSDHGMGLLEWTRTWATVPGQIVDYETFAYTYPGYASTLLTPGRVPITKQITSKLIMDFFLVGAGGAYASADLIPVIEGQQYLYPPWAGSQAAEYLDSSSSPSLAAYKALVTTDAASAASYSLEAQDSALELYLGNIWKRTRRHIKAR